MALSTPVPFVAFAVIPCLKGQDMERNMTPEGRQKLKALLLQHEKYVQFPYTDTTGHLTIGIGRNLSDRGISQSEALYLLDEDVAYFTHKLNYYLISFNYLSENRKIALIDMCFNLGIQGLLNFKEMISALDVHDYVRAADEMLNSKWAKQVGERAVKLASIMRTNEL